MRVSCIMHNVLRFERAVRLAHTHCAEQSSVYHMCSDLLLRCCRGVHSIEGGKSFACHQCCAGQGKSVFCQIPNCMPCTCCTLMPVAAAHQHPDVPPSRSILLHVSVVSQAACVSCSPGMLKHWVLNAVAVWVFGHGATGDTVVLCMQFMVLYQLADQNSVNVSFFIDGSGYTNDQARVRY